MTTTIEILVAARALLSDEKRWTRGDLAHDIDGAAVDPRSKNAVCWCVIGAVQKFSLGHQCDALNRIHNVVGGSGSEFNDYLTTTHADVLRVLDAAIEKATAEAQS